MSAKKLVLAYLCLVGIPVLVIFATLEQGRHLIAPAVAAGEIAIASAQKAASQPAGAPSLVLLIGQMTVILLAARILAVVFEKLKQPPVIGEMIAGIMLGPSLLGYLAPGISAALFPASSMGFLGAFSQLGLVLFMFMVGLELTPEELKGHSHAAILTSHASIVLPFAFASVLALYLYPRLSDSSVTFTQFALFLGCAMAITAFPVLARILSDRGLMRTRLGTMAIACAAIDDISGWCILAYIVALIRSSQSATSIWTTLGGLVVFMVVMTQGARRMLKGIDRQYHRTGVVSDNLMAAILLFVLVSALCTEALGLHVLFGAFIAGAVMPKNSAFVSYVTQKLESVTLLVLLPLFFAFTGLRTRIGLVHGREMWFFCLMIVGVAIVGKIGGSGVAAMVGGMGLKDSVSLGILMNTRGLMELVVLNLGLEIKVISPAVFSMMVIMALVTTFMTTPLLQLFSPARWVDQEAKAREAARSRARLS